MAVPTSRLNRSKMGGYRGQNWYMKQRILDGQRGICQTIGLPRWRDSQRLYVPASYKDKKLEYKINLYDFLPVVNISRPMHSKTYSYTYILTDVCVDYNVKKIVEFLLWCNENCAEKFELVMYKNKSIKFKDYIGFKSKIDFGYFLLRWK